MTFMRFEERGGATVAIFWEDSFSRGGREIVYNLESLETRRTNLIKGEYEGVEEIEPIIRKMREQVRLRGPLPGPSTEKRGKST